MSNTFSVAPPVINPNLKTVLLYCQSRYNNIFFRTSQHLIFFITYKVAQQAWLFVPQKPLQPNVMLLSSLISSLISYKENEVL